MFRSTENLLAQKGVKLSSEILMSNAKYEALKKEHEQMINKYESKDHRVSVAVQTDQVNTYHQCR